MSYLVIKRYHEVTVDWSTIRLIFQGTLFGVQFNLFMAEDRRQNTFRLTILYSSRREQSLADLSTRPTANCLINLHYHDQSRDHPIREFVHLIGQMANPMKPVNEWRLTLMASC